LGLSWSVGEGEIEGLVGGLDCERLLEVAVGVRGATANVGGRTGSG
jgi:hypothetical protein